MPQSLSHRNLSPARGEMCLPSTPDNRNLPATGLPAKCALETIMMVWLPVGPSRCHATITSPARIMLSFQEPRGAHQPATHRRISHGTDTRTWYLLRIGKWRKVRRRAAGHIQSFSFHGDPWPHEGSFWRLDLLTWARRTFAMCTLPTTALMSGALWRRPDRNISASAAHLWRSHEFRNSQAASLAFRVGAGMMG